MIVLIPYIIFFKPFLDTKVSIFRGMKPLMGKLNVPLHEQRAIKAYTNNKGSGELAHPPEPFLFTRVSDKPRENFSQ